MVGKRHRQLDMQQLLVITLAASVVAAIGGMAVRSFSRPDLRVPWVIVCAAAPVIVVILVRIALVLFRAGRK